MVLKSQDPEGFYGADEINGTDLAIEHNGFTFWGGNDKWGLTQDKPRIGSGY